MYHIPGCDQMKTRLPDEPEPVRYCDSCGGGIYEGDCYYNQHGDIYCKECMDEFKKMA